MVSDRTSEGLLKDMSKVCCSSAKRCQQESQTRGATLEKIGSATDNHTWAPETEAMFTLPVWPDPPNDEEPAHQGQIFKCICKEWEAQVANIKGAVAAEAEVADKGDNIVVNQDDSK